MLYSQWRDDHSQKHSAILKKISSLNDDEVIEYFRFENLSVSSVDFCLLFESHTKCHKIPALNCYFCGCPFFRFCDDGISKINGKTLYSYCVIDAKEGGQFESENAIHQDCSGCTIPHQEGFIRKYFTRNWDEAMAEIEIK